MTLATAYRIGQWLVTHLPRSAAYAIASSLAVLQYRLAHEDRRAVYRNLAVILGEGHPDIPKMAQAVFVNFGKYLVDFLRFDEVDRRFVNSRVTFEGRQYLDEALRRGRGAMILSAHLGNYELGAAIAAVVGYPTHIIVLNHLNPEIEAIFQRQRRGRGVHAIAVGMALRQVFACLRRNEVLGILADRDFFDNGIQMEFLGKRMNIPKGPAQFSIRTGASIVPTFVIREPDDRFRFIMEPPIIPEPGRDEAAEVERLTKVCITVLERYIRRYPSQWYLFRDFWRPGPWVIQ